MRITEIKRSLLILFLFSPFLLSAQRISGFVLNEKNQPLIGASVYWLDSSLGVISGTKGEFTIEDIQKNVKKLIATYAGYSTDTISITNQETVMLKLISNRTLGEVVVQSQKAGVIISDNNPIKIEQITQIELGKSACCDLAGCFETQTTVQPQTTNVITNSKELRIVGLSGVYNQVLIEGFPTIQGLTYTYGISSIPGTLVDNIYVAKGANSVLQGYESISGQINVETKEPEKSEKLLLNLYMNSFMEKHLNANWSNTVGKWKSLTAFHMVQPAAKTDRDDDNMLDLPLLKRYMFYQKWKLGNSNDNGWNSRIGLRFLHEERIGGQRNYDPRSDKGSTSVYGQSVRMNQPELWTKTGYRINENHQLVLFVSAFQQQQESYFGSVKYRASQQNLYANLQYEMKYAFLELKTGISFRHLNLTEDISFTDTLLFRTYNGRYKRLESIPGIFAENTMRFFDDKLTWIAGMRWDRHNDFGMQFTPRTLVKYDMAPKTVIRANIGTGWRMVNLFSENIGLLVSSRNVVFSEKLLPERAINYGFNFTQKFGKPGDDFTGYISADYYRTNFQNQIFPDYDTDPTKAIIQNFTGVSVSNGFQSEIYCKLFQRFELKAGYNFLDVYRMVVGEKRLLPFNPRNKILATFSYKPLSSQFHFDVNMHWYDKQRLPDTRLNPEEFRRPDYSQPYSVLNTQFTYEIKRFELYTGCENVFDFRQRQPIISWQNPFNRYFDTSSVWGPTRGREAYVGIRYKLER